MLSPSNPTDAAWCRTSLLALRGDPRNNPDYRNNPSLLVRVPRKGPRDGPRATADEGDKDADGFTNVVIDGAP